MPAAPPVAVTGKYQILMASSVHSTTTAPMSKISPPWPASAAQAADWPWLAEARGSLGHPFAPGQPTWHHSGRTLVGLAFDNARARVGVETLAHLCRKQGPPRSGQSVATQASLAPEEVPSCPKLRIASANQPIMPG